MSLAIIGWIGYPQFRSYWRQRQVENYEGSTSAKLLDVRDNEHMTQDQFGNRATIISVTIRFAYSVNGIEYTKSQTFEPSEWYIPIRPVDSLGMPEPYKVKYDLENPEKSTLLLW